MILEMDQGTGGPPRERAVAPGNRPARSRVLAGEARGEESTVRHRVERVEGASRRKLGAAIFFLSVLALPLPAADVARTVEVGPGERLSVADEGAGEPVLLLPSLTFPAFGFRRVVPLLVKAGRRVIVVEPLGQGGSSQPEAADYSLGAQADRVGRALDALQVGPVVVVAQAAGASTALRLAYRRPDRVRAVLSLEGGVSEEVLTPGARRAIRFAPLLKLFGGERLIRGRVRKTLVERSRDPGWVTPEVVDAYLRSAGADFDAILRTYRLMARATEAEPLRARLKDVRCPVRLLFGGSPHPSGVPEDELAAMRAGLARLELETVPGSGHFVAEEAPDAVARAVETLLLETATATAVPAESLCCTRTPRLVRIAHGCP